MEIFTLHIKTIVPNKDGRQTLTRTTHQVWDKEKFLAARQADAIRDGGHVEVITQEEYREHHGNWKKS